MGCFCRFCFINTHPENNTLIYSVLRIKALSLSLQSRFIESKIPPQESRNLLKNFPIMSTNLLLNINDTTDGAVSALVYMSISFDFRATAMAVLYFDNKKYVKFQIIIVTSIAFELWN